MQQSLDDDINVERDMSQIYTSYINTRKAQSLQSIFPDIAVEWHPSKNGNLTAEMVAPKSNKTVWWLGSCGHEWQMPVVQRTYQNCNCPICSGKRVESGINDLLTIYPSICEEWDYEKNNEIGLFPDKITSHSDKKAWWVCKKCGNKWQSKIDGRTRMGAGCPKCGKQKISDSKNKAVKCLESNIVYNSLKDAENLTGINKNCISNCCRGIQKTAGKLHWIFVDN